MRDSEIRLLLAEVLRTALTSLRQDNGWPGRTAEQWLKPFPLALRSYLGVDTDAPAERQQTHLIRLVDAGLQRLKLKQRDLVNWSWNREEDRLIGDWSERRHGRPDIGSYKTVERRFDDAVMKLVAAMLPADEPPLVLTEAQSPSARDHLRRVLAYRDSWHNNRLDVSVHVAADTVTVQETWSIEARTNGAQRFAIQRQFYWAGTKVEADVTEGADLEEVLRPHAQSLVLLVKFPDGVRRGERCHLVVTYTTEQMAPIYTNGWLEFEQFTVRLQFKKVRPTAVWLVENFPTRMFTTENIRPVLETYAQRVTDQVNAAGYYEKQFEPSDYTDEGLAWELPDTRWRDQ